MEVVQNSVLCHWFMPLCLFLKDRFNESLLTQIAERIAAFWKNAAKGSWFVRFLVREGTLSKAFKDSVLCTVLMAIINLPVRFFQWMYKKWGTVFEHSAVSQIGFAVVEQTPLAVAWLMLLVMVIPYEYWSNSYSFIGFAFCTVLAFLAGMRKKDYRLDLVSIGPWLVAFAGLVMVAWPLSAYPSQSQRFLLFHLTCMLCVVILVSTVEHWEQLSRLLSVSSVALLVMSLFALYQRIQGVEVNPSFVDMNLNRGMPGRVFSFYENPNSFGEVLLLLIPLAVALMLCSKSWTGRFLGFFSTAIGCVAMAMTYSRAGWVGLAFAAFLFVLFWKRGLVPVGIFIALVGLAFLPDTIFNRILTIFDSSDTSTNSRFPLYQAAGEFLQMRPLRGAGLGTDAVRSAISDLHLFHGHDRFVHCHNIYLQVWCETGLVGLVAFLGGVFGTVKRGMKAVSKAKCHPVVRLSVVGGIAALMGTMLCGIADYIWNYPRVMLIFWFVCAITLAGIRLAGRDTVNHTSEELPSV